MTDVLVWPQQRLAAVKVFVPIKTTVRFQRNIFRGRSCLLVENEYSSSQVENLLQLSTLEKRGTVGVDCLGDETISSLLLYCYAF
mmetsp:Transcript_23334/g.64894  ORF Transcript_23334/g.64894 Transcript_23334/m.64894 type:complete len:85 (-) Transcript_23334:1-255(-)